MTTPKSMTTILDELEKLEKEATPGPWVAEHNPDRSGEICEYDILNSDKTYLIAAEVENAIGRGNAVYIENMRNALPQLIAVIRRMEDGLRQYAEPFGNQWVNGVRQSVFFGDYHAKARETLAECEKILRGEK